MLPTENTTITRYIYLPDIKPFLI